jgi:AcrR family transcriptional regulator
MGTTTDQGRVNQKRRTRAAIVSACRELIETGGEITMPAVARSAEVSEATAYRYFPDLVSLLREAIVGLWPDAVAALEPVQDSNDPVERVAHATEVLARHVLNHQGAVRAMIAGSIARPDIAAKRPGYRFGLIDHALAPLNGAPGGVDAAGLSQLKLDLAVVISAEAMLTLVDLCGLSAEAAIASAVHTARVVTEAAVKPS